jgi:drug/metabolite transporter (DMT)-like permease
VNALALVLTKYLQRQDSSVTLMLYVNLATIVSFLPGVADPLPATLLWPWVCAICVAGPIGMYAGILALRYADASTLAPYTYVRLVLAMAGATLTFGEMPDFLSVIGVIFIVGACIIVDRATIASIAGWANACRASRLK